MDSSKNNGKILINKSRFKKMNRKARLESAKCWIPIYNGKNIVKGYSKRYGVDLICAILELRMLDVEITNEYEEKVQTSIAAFIKNKRIRRERNKEKNNNSFDFYPDSDENFAYIAGYTSWGFPYGVTWEEMGEQPPWKNN